MVYSKEETDKFLFFLILIFQRFWLNDEMLKIK